MVDSPIEKKRWSIDDRAQRVDRSRTRKIDEIAVRHTDSISGKLLMRSIFPSCEWGNLDTDAKGGIVVKPNLRVEPLRNIKQYNAIIFKLHC